LQDVAQLRSNANGPSLRAQKGRQHDAKMTVLSFEMDESVRFAAPSPDTAFLLSRFKRHDRLLRSFDSGNSRSTEINISCGFNLGMTYA
jgi:hypothetical protein